MSASKNGHSFGASVSVHTGCTSRKNRLESTALQVSKFHS